MDGEFPADVPGPAPVRACRACKEGLSLLQGFPGSGGCGDYLSSPKAIFTALMAKVMLRPMAMPGMTQG